MTAEAAEALVEVRPCTPDSWDDVVAVFDGAVDLARESGAGEVEGYPVDPAARPSASAAELYHGALQVFLRAGFTEVCRPSPARQVDRLDLAPPG